MNKYMNSPAIGELNAMTEDDLAFVGEDGLLPLFAIMDARPPVFPPRAASNELPRFNAPTVAETLPVFVALMLPLPLLPLFKFKASTAAWAAASAVMYASSSFLF